MFEYEVVTSFGVIQLKADTVITSGGTVIFKKLGTTVAEFYVDRIIGWVLKQ